MSGSSSISLREEDLKKKSKKLRKLRRETCRRKLLFRMTLRIFLVYYTHKSCRDTMTSKRLWKDFEERHKDVKEMLRKGLQQTQKREKSFLKAWYHL